MNIFDDTAFNHVSGNTITSKITATIFAVHESWWLTTVLLYAI